MEISWEKMSKSKFNGTDPEGAIQEYGTDVVRLFLLFKVARFPSYSNVQVPMDMVLDWDVQQIQGQYRWIRRLWALVMSYLQYKSEYKQVCRQFFVLLTL